MYLSRCQINPARRGARKLLGSPHALHAAVLSAFHQESTASGSRVLWRLDSAPPSHWLYLVSAQRPDLTHVIEQAGWPTTQEWITRDYSPLLQRLSSGQVWHFRLTANPTHAVRQESGDRSKRLAHVTAAQQWAWLWSRGPSLGVDLGSSAEEGTGSLVGRESLTFRRGSGRVTIARATFEGQLTVKNASLLQKALVGGVGPAKAYGCGLLTLAPVHA